MAQLMLQIIPTVLLLHICDAAVDNAGHILTWKN
jgi:hypothetical protein